MVVAAQAFLLVLPRLPPPPAPSRPPNQEGFDVPPSFMGGSQYAPFKGGSCLFGQARLPPSHGGRFPLGANVVQPPLSPFGFGFFSLTSTANQWHVFTFPGAIPEAVLSLVFCVNTQVPPQLVEGILIWLHLWHLQACIYACVCGCASASFDA